MSFLRNLLGKRTKSAEVAKERLHIILAHQRSRREPSEYLPSLQRDLIEVIARYVPIDREQVRVHLDREGDYEVLEVNIVLPDPPRNRKK